jgi:WD40 repeat protein
VPVIKDTSGDTLPSGAYARLGARDAGNKESADRAFTLTFSDDGRRLLAGACEGVLLYDVQSHKLPLRLTFADKVDDRYKRYASALAFSSDVKQAAAGWLDGGVAVWETTSGKRLWNKRDHVGCVTSLMFATSGRLLLSTAPDEVRWWDSSTGQPRRHFKLPDPENMWAPFVTPGARTVLVIKRKQDKMQEWELATGKLRREIKGSFIPLGYSADGRCLLAHGEAVYQLIDVASAKRRHAFPLPKFGETEFNDRSVLSGAALSPDGRLVAFIADNDLVQVLDTSTGKNIHDFRSPGGCLAVAFAPDGRTLASSCKDGTILLWRVSADGK